MEKGRILVWAMGIAAVLAGAAWSMSAAANLAQNGDFEKLANGAPEGWSVWGGSDTGSGISVVEGYSGNSVQIKRDTFDKCYLVQTVDLKDWKSQTIVLSAMVRVKGSGEFMYSYSGAKMLMLLADGQTAREAVIRENSDWKKITLGPWRVPDGVDSVDVLVGVHSAKGIFCFDNVTLTPATVEEADRIRNPNAAPTFKEMMAPELFPDSQCGMEVESVLEDEGLIRITTTGAVIEIRPTSGEILFQQRLGHARPVAELRLAQPLRGTRITHSERGFARITVEQPRLTVRVNGDSLFMLQGHEPLAVAVDRKILPAFSPSYQKNHLVMDEWGGFGLYCSETTLEDHFNPDNETVASYALQGDTVLCVGVCPPKPYDWERSFGERVVWQYSSTAEFAYPPNDLLRAYRNSGNIILLQSDAMFWKDWNLDFVPRLGNEEFARVRETVHDLGMRFIVYTSPKFFLKGTEQESRAVNDQPGACPGASGGENMGLFMEAITRVMRDLKPDGLYFDGQYSNDPASLYALARSSRKVVGEEGILEWHSSAGLGGGICYMPQADAYVDFHLRGEGNDRQYADFDYLRFFISGYNINNCISFLCNNGNAHRRPSEQFVEDVLRANVRFQADALGDTTGTAYIPPGYFSRLTPKLREELDSLVDAGQAKIPEKLASLRAERESLGEPSNWGSPVFEEEFTAIPTAPSGVSSQNSDPFSVADGSLRIRAHANTFAYYRFPLKARARGLVIKLRQGTDGGMFWGPRALLRWPDGTKFGLGTRSDRSLTVTGPEGQFDGGVHDPRNWVWLRARWGKKQCVFESSTDGHVYQRVWAFERAESLNEETGELIVGKIACSGLDVDYVTPGGVGECEIDFVRVYGEQP